MIPLLAFHIPGIEQSSVILVIALLIFGKRLPEVGRSLGKGIVEFKRGIKGIEDDVETASATPGATTPRPALPPQQQSSQQPDYKFDPHTGQPIQPPVAPAMKFDPYTGKPLGTSTLVVPPAVDAEVIDASSATAAQPIRGY